MKKTRAIQPAEEGATAPAVTNKSSQLEAESTPGLTRDQMIAKILTSGDVACAATATAFSRNTYGDVSLTDLARSITKRGDAVIDGDLSEGERLLNSQLIAMNAIFNELARRSALNLGEHLSAAETYMRLALKAQAQCRSTVEALAEMKNPRSVAFVKQANISGGPQQVNNAPIPTVPRARARKTDSQQTRLLEATNGKWLDTGATGSTSRANQAVETVGRIDRADD